MKHLHYEYVKDTTAFAAGGGTLDHVKVGEVGTGEWFAFVFDEEGVLRETTASAAGSAAAYALISVIAVMPAATTISVMDGPIGG